MAKSGIKKAAKKTKTKKNKASLLKKLEGKIQKSRKELLAQVNELSSEIVEFKNNNSAKKIAKKLKKKYKKKLSKLQKEFSEKLDDLNAVQSKVVGSLPKEVTDALHINTNAKKVESKQSKSAPSLRKPMAVKSNLSKIKGIGPVTVKNLQEAGINSLEDLANPSGAKAEALKAFEKTKGFNSWSQQAKDILSKG